MDDKKPRYIFITRSHPIIINSCVNLIGYQTEKKESDGQSDNSGAFGPVNSNLVSSKQTKWQADNSDRKHLSGFVNLISFNDLCGNIANQNCILFTDLLLTSFNSPSSLPLIKIDHTAISRYNTTYAPVAQWGSFASLRINV